MSQLTMWERVKTGGKTGFDKTWKALDKLGGPVNKLSNKLGSEAFWPTTLDKESDKAARILKSFCKDGFYAEEEYQSQEGPKLKQRVIQKIPERVIQRAKGLAIFTTMRTGLWMSGAGGSGVLVARKPDGTWSPPSGILLHTAGLGFLIGIDIYDCVVVINTEEAMQAFTKLRCTLGSEISVAAGPVGAGGVLETEIHKRQAPIYTYMKSRGFYAGVQIDGSIIIERTDENERFYNQRLSAQEILAGRVRHPPYEVRRLMETIKSAQGDRDVDETMIPTEAPPGDYEIDDGHAFGVPDKDDPDPYGVLALEKEGMSLKEAGTKKRASWEEFSFRPSPTSPVHDIIARQSDDKARSSRRGSWRTSVLTNEPKSPSSLRNSIDQPSPTIMADSGTQTELGAAPNQTLINGARRSTSSNAPHRIHMQEVVDDEVFSKPTERKTPPVQALNGTTTPPATPPPEFTVSVEDHDDGDTHVIEEPIVHSIQTIQPASPTALSKPRIINVPKRVPPKLPPRNPNRGAPSTLDTAAADLLPRETRVPASPEMSNTHEDPEDEHDSVTRVESGDSSQLEDVPLAAHDVPEPAGPTTRMPGEFE